VVTEWPCDSPDIELVGLEYLPDDDALFLALSNGDMLSVSDLNNPMGARIDCVGNMEFGVYAMAWSPDGDLVACVTGNGMLMMLSRDYTLIAELPIDTDAFGESAFVNVGWGKKETQFHGSIGRTAALETASPSASLSNDDDDYLPRLSWRGDGAFVSCSTVDANGDRRTIRVFNREGILQSTSEPVNQLEHTLAWRYASTLHLHLFQSVGKLHCVHATFTASS
jgi:elongator complex protein 1